MRISGGASAAVTITQGGNTAVVLAALADGVAVTIDTLAVAGFPSGFNGSTWDRLRTLGPTALLGLGQLCVSGAIPGAGPVLSVSKSTASNSTTRATVLTPASGKKVRIISISQRMNSATLVNLEVYFGTGAGSSAALSKVIWIPEVDLDNNQADSIVFGDGSGPVGIVDEVVSFRTSVDISGAIEIIVHWREE